MARRHKPFNKKKEKPNKINREIRASQIRLVGDNVEQGVYTFSEAYTIAKDLELDLVMMSLTNDDIAICRVVDYNKYLYDRERNKSKVKSKPMKEVRFTPTTDDNDFNTKLKQAKGFLDKGHKVKVLVFFRGRQMIYMDQGKELLLKFAIELEDHGSAEAMPAMMGRKMHFILKPKK